MLKNYLITAIRTLLRHKVFSMINILGLAIGLAAATMITLWVYDELSYDRFHENSDRIFRVERDIVYKGQAFFVPVTGAVYGTTLYKDYPEVESMVRINPLELSIENHEKTRFNERVLFVDTSFFEVFTYPLVKGNPHTALTEPYSIILSPDAAIKYFGDEDPLNKVLRLDFSGELKNFKVTGVLDVLPKNSHFHFEVLASFSTLEEEFDPERLTTWLSNYLYTYVLLKEGIDKEQLENKFQGLVEEYILPAYQEFFGGDEEIDGSFEIFLRPISKIHLKSGLMWDIEPQGDMATVRIFIVVALMILLIASFNFMNLSTALAGARALEIGIRKTVGSTKRQIINQFLGESIITTIIAAMIAIGLVEIFLPAFNTLTDKSLSLSVFGQWQKLGALLLIIAATGIISGIYPAFYLSSIKPILVLKSRLQQRRGKFSFRQALVVLQFVISIALIIGTLTAFQQLAFIENKPLGYDKDNIMVMPVESNYVRTHFDAFKNDLLMNPEVFHVTASARVPAERNYSDSGWETELLDEAFMSAFFSIDFDFFDTYKLETVAGRPFSKEFSTDKNNKYIINETAVKKLGLSSPEEAIGKKYFSSWISEEQGVELDGEIIGVVKDFHFKSLKNQIEPITLFIAPDDWVSRISVKYQEGKDQEIVQFVEETWKKNFPEVQFEYSFITDKLRSYYVGEEKMKTILLAFSILGIFVACLGLFGLASFIAQSKTKEIGVRKVLGAKSWDIVYRLTRTFTIWVLIANVISWPLAWYFLNDWLNNFPYHINLNILIFLIAGLISLLIAVVTVSTKAYLASQTNPVDALKYE